MDEMINRIGEENIKLNQKVKEINYEECEVRIEDGTIIKGDLVVITVSIGVL